MPRLSPTLPFGEFQHDGKIGVIDIGSNSIRLVVYDGVKRVPVPMFNEKMMCALGRGLGSTGRLNPEGVEAAHQCLARLMTMVRMLGVAELQVLATAAIRDAEDGEDFVAEVEARHHLRVRVISGAKEAQLAGYGVLANIHAPDGIVGDLGGGSMEVVNLHEGELGPQATLPIGPLRLLDMEEASPERIRAAIREAMLGVEWLPEGRGRAFYAVGGSFRAIAKIQMDRQMYPLSILHQYRSPAEIVRETCHFVQSLSVEQLRQLDVPGKRAASLGPAAIALEEIISTTEAAEVVFCASGIREGYLYEHLSPFAQAEDPLIASATDLSRHEGLRIAYARELFAWMKPVFGEETSGEMRLRQALCILSEIAWHIHPEYRGAYAFQRTLHSAIVGLGHAERVALAVAMHHRYKYKEPVTSPFLELLSPRQLAWGQAAGVAAHLAFQLSGGMPGNLPLSRISLSKKHVELELDDVLAGALDEGIHKRLKALGARLGDWTGA